MTTWRDVWAKRRLDPARGSTLAQLMAADGFDSPFSAVDEAAWRRYVARVGAALGVGPGTSVFEVGCGAGAFVYDWYQAGATIAALEPSDALRAIAQSVMPDARLAGGDAAALDGEPFDVVVSNGVFLYFPSLDYARAVLDKMAHKARRGLAILDVPDRAHHDAALAMRRGLLDEQTYRARYQGLDHLYFDRDWFRALPGWRVTVEDQQIDGYPNGAHRFNVIAVR